MTGPTTESKSADTRRNSAPQAVQTHAPVAPTATSGNRATLRLMRKCACGGGSDCDCDTEPNKHRKTDLHRSATESASQQSEAPAIVHDVLRSPGSALDPGTRSFFESHFGRDFSAVRLHTDSRAAQSARAVHAHAYAVGNDIAFAEGRYAPATPAGRRLLAHELAHTVQQSTGEPAANRRLQPKLTVGATNDPLEAEADRAADHVMRMADLGPVTSSELTISRKCFACEDEDKKLHAKNDGQAAAEAPSMVQEVLDTPGQPLDPAIRAFMEPRFGHDFSKVRVHIGGKAAESARSIRAHAYAHQNQIVFAAESYQPNTDSGRRLIAHELAHTAQRGTGPASLRRADDFSIRGVNPNAAAASSTIFFDLGNSTIPPSEAGKIVVAAAPPTTSLTLNGFSSEEGSPAQNVPIINARISAVQTALQAAGHTGPIVANPQPAAGEGQLDYRRVRAVEIVPAGGTPSTPQCQITAANPHPEDEPCGSAFSTAQPIAYGKVNNALIAVTTSSATATAQLATSFPGVAATTIITKLASLLNQLLVMAGPAGIRCHNACDGACSRPGFMGGQGTAAVMTVCPEFLYNLSSDDRVEMLIHEGMHATTGIKVRDKAYRSQRVIDFLSGGQAEANTDSYVNLILSLQPGVVGPIAGGPPVDTPSGLSSAEATAAERALAFLEKWVEVAEWDTSQLYEAIKHNVGRAGGWDPAHDYHAQTEHAIGWILHLTDPGPAPPYLIPPVHDDQVKVAGIHDRYNRMNGAVNGTKIAMSKGVTEAWAPGAGAGFVVKADFFGIDPGDQVLRLITLLAGSMPDIPASVRSNYADAANQIRWHKTGIGP